MACLGNALDFLRLGLGLGLVEAPPAGLTADFEATSADLTADVEVSSGLTADIRFKVDSSRRFKVCQARRQIV